MAKKPTIPVYSAATVRALRRRLGLNQQQFWSPIGVTQSGGSRYETSRTMPSPVRKLVWLMYESALANASVKNDAVRAVPVLEKLRAI